MQCSMGASAKYSCTMLHCLSFFGLEMLGCEVTVRLTEVVRNVPDSTARELQRWRLL